jgi:NAD(P)-dependent dehydrogenase (short-subunit alcohol dehydrogenase family)
MRRILVTGANKGVGLAICRAILESANDTAVLMGSRSIRRGEAALAGLLSENPQWRQRLGMLPLDVASDESVQEAAEQVRAEHPNEPTPLYAIVNNAGTGFGSGDLESTLNVNVHGIHRVCQSFIPLLEADKGRVVNITSASGPNYVSACSAEHRSKLTDPEMDWQALSAFMTDTVNAGRAGRDGAVADGQAYGFSKACANSYTVWLAKTHPGLRVNACTPGWIETDMTRPRAEATGQSPQEMGMKPPSEGTVSAMFLLFGEPPGNGNYYGSDACRSPMDRYRAPGSAPYTGD